jgi:hypothetical protein
MREILQDITDEYTAGGETVTVLVGRVVKAAPDSGGAQYIRMSIGDESWIWNAPVAGWNETVAEDDPRWIAE